MVGDPAYLVVDPGGSRVTLGVADNRPFPPFIIYGPHTYQMGS